MDSESELSLEFKPSFNPKRLIEFLREIRLIGDRKKKLSKLAEYICCLEEELRKIDAFKRELPLCMLLMQDAIGVLRDEEMHCGKLVLEEFMLPVKRKINEDGGVKREKDCSDKMNWMTSAQLWSVGYNNNNDNTNNNKNKSTDVKEQKEEESIRTAYEYSFPGCKYSNEGGAFTPFKGILSEVVLPLPDLSLMSSGMKKLSTDSDLNLESSSKPLNPATTQSNSQPRKARRCWSPELHSRFVNALHQLGGLQVATPKQIRELMKDDGLTNDEVKSHLQKYRLHTRRLSGTESNSQSRSPESPFQLTGTDCEDDDGKSEIWQ